MERNTHLDLDRRALVDHVSWLELLLEPFDLLSLRVAVQKRRVRRHDGLDETRSSKRNELGLFGEDEGGKHGRAGRNGTRVHVYDDASPWTRLAVPCISVPSGGLQ